MTSTPAPRVSRYLGAKPSQSRSPVPASTSATSSNPVLRRRARKSAMLRQPFTPVPSSLAQGMVKPLETLAAARQQFVIAPARLRPTLEHPVEADALGRLEFPVLQVGVMHHLGDFQHGLVGQAKSLHQRLEGAILAVVGELDLKQVVGN